MAQQIRVLITRILPASAGMLLEKAGFHVTRWNQERDMTKEELLEWSASHDAILTTGGNRIDQQFFKSCPSVRIVSQFAVGYDNIDVPAATAHGIAIGNTPDAVTHATADIAFLLMQAVSRKATFLHRKILNGGWRQFEPIKHLGIELRGKTLGIFGMGRIGTEMSKRCIGAFQMNVIYNNRNRNLAAEASTGASFASFEKLLESSDVLSVHCPLTSETRGIFNTAAFNHMKSGAIFINTSRGAVHVEPDLKAALDSGKIWGAGLDVTDPEPMSPDHPMLLMENVVILPHVGSGTVETRDDMARTAAANIISFFQKGRPVNCVNPDFSSEQNNP